MQEPAKAEMLAELSHLLRQLFREHEHGASGADLARAHGYLDGYMQAMLDAGLARREELLALVGAQRSSVHGRGVGEVASDIDEPLPEANAA